MQKKQYIYNSQASLWGDAEVIGFGDDSFLVKEMDRKEACEVIKKNHYSKKVYTATYINLGVFVLGELKGVLQFGYAMNPASCGSVVEGTKMDQYLELNRMWIEDGAGTYPESRAISCATKYIKRKYPKIKWVQSFADERCGGFGIVYQACSFSYYGEHNSTFWELDGETFHNSIKTREKAGLRGYKLLNDPANSKRIKKHTLRQFRYIKFIDGKWKKRCLLKERKFPKYYEEANHFG